MVKWLRRGGQVGALFPATAGDGRASAATLLHTAPSKKSKEKNKAGRAAAAGDEPSEAPTPVAGPAPPPAAAPKPAASAATRAEADRRIVWNKTARAAVGAASTGGVGRYVMYHLRK